MNRREAKELEHRLGVVATKMLEVTEALSAASKALADLTVALSPLVRKHPIPGDTIEVFHQDHGWLSVEVTGVASDRFLWRCEKARISSGTLYREMGWWRWPGEQEVEIPHGFEPAGGDR